MHKKVLITGASGFIGTHLTNLLAKKQFDIISVSRNSASISLAHKSVQVETIDKNTNWIPLLHHSSTIVHLAARVHVMHECSDDPLASFRRVNVDGALNLARQAAERGVKRFVFLSSIGVNGTKTEETPFHPSTPPAPAEPYSISKLEAENGLLRIARETGLEVVIIRPPLVYGKGAPGNFARLQTLIASGIPLPFASINNKRSLVGIDNLCHCIKVCLDHPNATRKPLLISDNQDISTPGLIRLIAAAAGRAPRLLPFPVSLLRMLASLAGRGPEIGRLTENLQVDCTETLRLLDWQPPVNLEEEIRRSIS
jgi:UDP-glucose 4-epimerase